MLINILGDSITEGVGASSYEKCYVSQLEKITGFTVNNYGISGTRIARQKQITLDNPTFDQDFLSRVKNMDKNADLVFVFGGTNDFGHGYAEIGNINDETPYTFYGAMKLLISELVSIYPINKIVFILPLHRWNEDNPKGDGFRLRKTLEEYRMIMIEILQKYGVPYIDFKEELGKPNAIEYSEYFMDGLHPNDKGHALLAKLIYDYVKGRNL